MKSLHTRSRLHAGKCEVVASPFRPTETTRSGTLITDRTAVAVLLVASSCSRSNIVRLYRFLQPSADVVQNSREWLFSICSTSPLLTYFLSSHGYYARNYLRPFIREQSLRHPVMAGAVDKSSYDINVPVLIVFFGWFYRGGYKETITTCDCKATKATSFCIVRPRPSSHRRLLAFGSSWFLV